MCYQCDNALNSAEKLNSSFVLRFLSDNVKWSQISPHYYHAHIKDFPQSLQKHNQSAQYAQLGQWAMSPFENVDTFDRCGVDPPDCG